MKHRTAVSALAATVIATGSLLTMTAVPASADTPNCVTQNEVQRAKDIFLPRYSHVHQNIFGEGARQWITRDAFGEIQSSGHVGCDALGHNVRLDTMRYFDGSLRVEAICNSRYTDGCPG